MTGTTVYRGTCVPITDLAIARRYMEACAAGDQGAVIDIVVQQITSGERSQWWNGGQADDSRGAGGWWCTSESMAWKYAYDSLYDHPGIPVLFTAQDDPTWEPYHEEDAAGTWWWHLPPGTPVNLSGAVAVIRPPSEAQSALESFAGQGQWATISEFSGTPRDGIEVQLPLGRLPRTAKVAAQPTKLFHAAPRSARDSITQHGLDWTLGNPDGAAPHGNFFHVTRAAIDDMLSDGLAATYDLYEVNVRGLGLNFEQDPYDTEAIYTPTAIPPERLHRVTKLASVRAHLHVGVLDPARFGQCYNLSLKYVKDHEGWILVHGLIGRPDSILKQGDPNPSPPIGHAWAISADNNTVWEPISNDTYPATYFMHLFGADEWVRYTQTEALVQALKTSHWGPWDPAYIAAEERWRSAFLAWQQGQSQVTAKVAVQDYLTWGMNHWRASFHGSGELWRIARDLLDGQDRADSDERHMVEAILAALKDAPRKRAGYRVDDRVLSPGDTIDFPLVSVAAGTDGAKGYEQLGDVFGGDGRKVWYELVDFPALAFPDNLEYITSGRFRVTDAWVKDDRRWFRLAYDGGLSKVASHLPYTEDTEAQAYYPAEPDGRVKLYRGVSAWGSGDDQYLRFTNWDELQALLDYENHPHWGVWWGRLDEAMFHGPGVVVGAIFDPAALSHMSDSDGLIVRSGQQGEVVELYLGGKSVPVPPGRRVTAAAEMDWNGFDVRYPGGWIMPDGSIQELVGNDTHEEAAGGSLGHALSGLGWVRYRRNGRELNLSWSGTMPAVQIEAIAQQLLKAYAITDLFIDWQPDKYSIWYPMEFHNPSLQKQVDFLRSPSPDAMSSVYGVDAESLREQFKNTVKTAAGPGLYFHVSPEKLPVGTILRPGNEVGKASFEYGDTAEGYLPREHNTKVWMTDRPGSAEGYVAFMSAPRGGPPERSVYVYLVRPIGPVTPGGNLGGDLTASSAEVVADISSGRNEFDYEDARQSLSRTAAGTWDMSGDEPVWVQPHEELLIEALFHWKGDPHTLPIAYELAGEPMPGSGSGKQMRAWARALIEEIKTQGRPNTKQLYRGSHVRPTGLCAFSEKRSVANAWAKKNDGQVWVLPAHAGIGLRIDDYITSGLAGEDEWIIDMGRSSLGVEAKLASTETIYRGMGIGAPSGRELPEDEARALRDLPRTDPDRAVAEILRRINEYSGGPIAGVWWSTRQESARGYAGGPVMEGWVDIVLHATGAPRPGAWMELKPGQPLTIIGMEVKGNDGVWTFIPVRNQAITAAPSGRSLDQALEELGDVLSQPGGHYEPILPSAVELYGGYITERADGTLMLDGQPVKKLYRVVDPEEWRIAQEQGYLESHGGTVSSGDRGYTRASAQPDERWRYQMGQRGYTLEIDYDPADRWHASAEGYAATHERIPLTRVRKVGYIAKVGAALSMEDMVSVAENVMAKSGLTGKRITIPEGHEDDPDYQAAIAPIIAWASGIAGRYVKVYTSAYSLRQEGDPFAFITGTGNICAQPTTNELTLLHELAHIVSGVKGHGQKFVRTAHQLYAEHLGSEAAERFWTLLEPYMGDKTAKTAGWAWEDFDIPGGYYRRDGSKEEIQGFHPDLHLYMDAGWVRYRRRPKGAELNISFLGQITPAQIEAILADVKQYAMKTIFVDWKPEDENWGHPTPWQSFRSEGSLNDHAIFLRALNTDQPLGKIAKTAVTLYHGTNAAAAERIKREGFQPSDTRQIAQDVEGLYGLPADSVWNHFFYAFDRSRNGRGKAYFTTNLNVAADYASQGGEALSHALQAAWSVLHDGKRPYLGSDEWDECEAWVAQQKVTRFQPTVITVDLPLTEVQESMASGEIAIPLPIPLSAVLDVRTAKTASSPEDLWHTPAHVEGTPGGNQNVFYNRDTDTLFFTDSLAPKGGPSFRNEPGIWGVATGAYFTITDGEIAPGDGTIAPTSQTVYNPLLIEALERLVDTFPQFGRFSLREGTDYASHARIGTLWDFLRSVNDMRAEYATQHTGARSAHDIYLSEYFIREHAQKLSKGELTALIRRILTDGGFPHADEAEGVDYPDPRTSCVAWDMQDGLAIPLVAFGAYMHDELTVIHECAHILRNGPEDAGRVHPVDDTYVSHDDRWFEVYTALMRRYASPDCLDRFELNFDGLPKTASQTVRLWRGLQVADATDEELEAIRRDPAGFARQHLNDPIGIHWTDDPTSAWNFSQGRDPEGWASESDGFDEDEGGVWTIGLVVEGEVAESDIVQPGTAEHDGYAFSDAILDYGIEREVTVRGGSQVRLTSVTVTAVGEDGSDVDFHAGLGMTVRAKLGGMVSPLQTMQLAGQITDDQGETFEVYTGDYTGAGEPGHVSFEARLPGGQPWTTPSGRSRSYVSVLVMYPSGEVEWVQTEEQYQRRGIAEALYRFVKQIRPDLHHSKFQTWEGAEWSRSVGAKLAWNTNGITLFHGTIGFYADRILRDGLKPRDMAEVQNHWDEKAISHPGLVYLSHESRMTVSRLAMAAARKAVMNQLYPIEELEKRQWAVRPDSYSGRGITPEYTALDEQIQAMRAQIEADPRLESVLLAVTIPRDAWGNLEPDEDTINYAHPVSEMTGMPEWMGSLGSDAVVAYRGEIPSSWIRVQSRGRVADTAGMSTSYGDDWRHAASLDFTPSMA